MYETYFQLRERPFRLTPDPDYRYSEPSQHAALCTLQVALAQGEGFIKVTGEVGLGKTLLCRTLMDQLQPPFLTAWLPDPTLTPAEMRRSLARDLGIDPDDELNSGEVTHQLLQQALLQLAQQGRKPVLIIDEAQALPDDTLEALRLLTNLETRKRKLIQVVLFGQPELDERLARPDFRQLRQRITFSCRLQPLGRQQVRDYVQYRCHAAGASRSLFTGAALRLASRASGGIPRLLNILCDKALLAAYGRGRHQAGWQEMRRAVVDTDSVAGVRARRWWVPTAGLLMLGLSAWVGRYWDMWGGSLS